MNKQIIFFEFFCGSGTLTKTFRANGVKCYSFDIRQRKGVCEPDFRYDLTDFTTFEDLIFKCRIAYDLDSFFSKYIPVFFFAIPCTSWSIASGGYHFDRDFNPKTKQAEKDLILLDWFMSFWESAGKPFFYLENPFGLLRKFEKFTTFCEANKVVEHVVNMGDFGFPSKKPTNIFTNSFIDTDVIEVKERYTGGFNNMTVAQRQAYPELFCEFIYLHFVGELPGIVSKNYPGQGRNVTGPVNAMYSVHCIESMQLNQNTCTDLPAGTAPDHSKKYIDL